jgi:HEAT repeat protein
MYASSVRLGNHKYSISFVLLLSHARRLHCISAQDVSGLFPDVLKNMQTEDIEQKKLVYLYLINYAKTQPELVILAVNTFVKDSDDPNPLIRALAIRTMGCIRVEKIIDYLCDPLQKCLRDDNPYVRKTAALCVAKLYDLKPELVMENGFLEQLHDMIGDSNPMVRIACLPILHHPYIGSRSSQIPLRRSQTSTLRQPPSHLPLHPTLRYSTSHHPSSASSSLL